MVFNEGNVLPAARTEKEFESLLRGHHEFIVLLNSHIAQLKSMIGLAKKANKKVLLHADLIQGLAQNEYAAQFICQQLRPEGLISTRKQMLKTARQHKMTAVQRLFLLDSIALETSYRLIDDVKPDVIEVLPGVIPGMIREVAEKTKLPIVAGGLIRTKEEAEAALGAGAVAISTTRKELWDI
ncbi:glycerol-3-phosphate responsive antiterminator [Alteribacillus sp. HJP-4]|uniref:glycerol-3-phosphate responsive antiterminator n=1 Tax=Alteribacillus sp. HJP-4 TaxID=2775394 RepID=UPI0035CD1E2A